MENVKSSDIAGEFDHTRVRDLFVAIVRQAFTDACSNPTFDPLLRDGRKNNSAQARHTMALRDRERARKWLLTNGRDFQLIVSLAGFDPEFICDRAKAVRDDGWRLVEAA